MNSQLVSHLSPTSIRVRASAAIVRDEKILLVEYDDDLLGHHFNLPGGGVEPGESMRDAVRREVHEETMAEVDVGPLLLAWEFRPEETDEEHLQVHAVGLIFRAALRPGSEPRLPPTPDRWQTDIRWVPLTDLSRVRLLPRIAGRLLEALRAPVGFDRFVVETAVPFESGRRARE